MTHRLLHLHVDLDQGFCYKCVNMSCTKGLPTKLHVSLTDVPALRLSPHTGITTAATNLDGAVQKAITAVQADQTVVDDATADKFIDALTSISDASKTISARFIAIKGNLTQLGVLDATKKLVKGATADVKTLGAGLVGKIPPTKRKSAQKLVDDINASWSKAAQSYS